MRAPQVQSVLSDGKRVNGAARQSGQAAQRLARLQRVSRLAPQRPEQQPASGSSSARDLDVEQALNLLLPSTAGLAAIAADVFGPFSPHLLQPVDSGVHAWVLAHLAEGFRGEVAGQLLSNTPITLGLTCCTAVALTAAAVTALPSDTTSSSGSSSTSSGGSSERASTAVGRLQRRLVTAVGVYMLGGGSMLHGDPPLVAALKNWFQRVRPSPHLHHTFAFPSGHTTAVTFVTGTLLFLLLPALLEALEAADAEQRLQREGGSAGRWWGSLKLSGPIRRQQQQQQEEQAWQQQLRQGVQAVALGNRMWLWPAAVATTACGRVCADAHWVSDTLAGACLGTSLVAATVLLCSAADWLVDTALPAALAERKEA